MASMRRFTGRSRDMQRLRRHLDSVTRDGQGRLLSVRGRRQAGKSRLVTEFADRTKLPQFFFTGSRLANQKEELSRLAMEAARSSLPGASLFEGVTLDGWAGAFQLIAAALPDGPAIVILDEFPWLCESTPGLEGALQVAWDRVLEARPALFILIGSDISMMEALSTYERPLFGRIKEMVVNPFELADTAAMIGASDPAVAVDAQLITGGYPRICAEWRGASDAQAFFGQQLSDENSDLIDVGRNVLAAEFPPDLQATRVLTVIGGGKRTNKKIAEVAGVREAPLARSLETLREAKRMIAVDRPVSLRPRNDPRYRVADSYLRFWLRFIGPSLPDIARGRPDLALERVRHWWPEYRGRAVEPLVRQSLERIAATDPVLAGAGVIGAYWTRASDVEVDIVGVDQWPGARSIAVVGSIKWREHAPFDRQDLAALSVHQSHLPGADSARLIAVSRSGCTADVHRGYGPADLIDAWRS
ncbi:ATP-binding protein [Trebonia kvetii]|nr:ATP-binding protein [Trebonia kvetii]